MWSTCTPIFISIKYGQNTPINVTSDAHLDQMAEQWNSEVDYSKVHFFSFALATEIRCEISVLT